MKGFIILLLILGILVVGCCGITLPTSGQTIQCNRPYILVGGSCCLDANDNQICDADETSTTTSASGQLTCSGSSSNYCQQDTLFYDPECRSGQWIFKTQHCEYGCENGACTSQKCPVSCDDSNICTQDFCSSATNYVCNHQVIVPCCGNGQCESGETYVTCSRDCEKPTPIVNSKIELCGKFLETYVVPWTEVYVTVENYGETDMMDVAISGYATQRAGYMAEPEATSSVALGNIPAGYKMTQRMVFYGPYSNVTLNITGVDEYGTRYHYTASSTSCGGYTPEGKKQFDALLGILVKIATYGAT